MPRWIRAHPVLSVLMGLLVVGVLAGGYLMIELSRRVNLSGFIGSGSAATVRLPDGFELEVFASKLSGPRFIVFGPDGSLYAAERGADRIIRLPDRDRDGRTDSVEVAASGLDGVHSLTFHGGALFAGVPTGVVKLEDPDGDGQYDRQTVLIDDYPTGGHNTRTVLFLPDGSLVVSIGSSCNSCLETDPRRAAIVRYRSLSALHGELYATGLRNAVGLTLHPQTGELWITNNGRDLMGPDVPPDTIRRISPGTDYGWPECHAGQHPDPELGSADSCQGVPAPEVSIQAHSAPLGLVFYASDQFPAEYAGDLFVAYHGSWNRDVPTGYKVVRIPFEAGMPSGEPRDFATGWYNPVTGGVSGRPVGLAVGPDGALYVSDDRAGFIYRIVYAP